MTVHLTTEQIEGFRKRVLSPQELLRVDDHLANCEQCSTIFANSPSLDEAYSSLRRSLTAESQSTLGQFTLVAANCTVLIDGEVRRRGTVIRTGSTIVSLGRAAFALDNVQVETDDVRTQFSALFDSAAGEWRITPMVGHLRFVDGANPARYAVALGEHIVRPLGTRFEARAGAHGRERVTVYQESVEIRSGNACSILTTGTATDFVTAAIAVADDPTAHIGVTSILGPRLGCKGIGKVRRGKHRSFSVDSRRRLVSAEKHAWSADIDAKPYVIIALALADNCERAAAADALQQAIDRDPELIGIISDDLWALLRAMCAKEGDFGMADRLLNLLDMRSSSFSDTDNDSRIREAYNDWMEAMNAVSPKYDAALVAARNIERYGGVDDRLFVIEALVQAGTERPAHDLGALRIAAKIAREYTSDVTDQMASRSTAIAWQRLGEALFYLGDREQSLEATRRAVEIWPRPRWKVHLATRMCETQEVDRDEVLSMLRAGIAEDPCYYSYHRMWVALVRLAASEQDWQDINRLTIWIAETYSSIQAANLVACAHFRAIGDDRLAALFVKRVLAAPGGAASLNQLDRNYVAEVLWRQGRRDEALQVVRFTEGHAIDQQAWCFFDRIGEYETALQIIRDPGLDCTVGDNDWGNQLFNEGGLLVKLSRQSEARSAYQEQIERLTNEARSERIISPNTLIETRLCLGELVLTDDPENASALGRQALQEIPTAHFGATERVKGPLYYSARAHWLIGDRETAIIEMERNIALWPHIIFRKDAEVRLAKWRSELAASS